MTIQIQALWRALYEHLQENRERFNREDRANQNHGDHLLAAWEAVDAAQQAQLHDDPAEWLACAGRTLGVLPDNGAARAYAVACESLVRRFEEGSLTQAVLVDLALRLSQPASQTGIDNKAAGLLAERLLKHLGGQGRMQRLAEQFGVAGLLEGGLQALRASNAGQEPLETGVALLVSRSPLSAPQHRRQAAESILALLLREIARHT